MSDTPRTDKAEFSPAGHLPAMKVVLASEAREMERALSEETREKNNYMGWYYATVEERNKVTGYAVKLEAAALNLLSHCDRNPVGETAFERDVIHLRNVIEKMDHLEGAALSKNTAALDPDRPRPECPMGSKPCHNPLCAVRCNMIDDDEAPLGVVNPSFIGSKRMKLREIQDPEGGFIRVGLDGTPLSRYDAQGTLAWLNDDGFRLEYASQHPAVHSQGNQA